MKLIKSAFIACSIALLTAGCSSNSGLTIATTDDVQQMIDDQQTGFVVITNEIDAPFLDEIEKALLEKKETSLQFNVFRNNGKNQNSDGLSKNPFRSEMSHVNTLYYVKGGQTYGEYDLETFEGLRQQEELGHFINSMTGGEANE
ncbi:hypothetical protein KZO01_08980 [Kurthia zopfii]|uniref:Lipoprotein n=1 Tax=Kurthia zopfii TaxID=1650 RepID=A0A8B4QDV2_9BACL|nr:hypothetical protein [Kurthia zopfii]PWI22719.1 hypothetical protein DF281_05995 [Kurthia zopfii]TDR39520.1 hypothetical protein DFR61_11146 [Kurthia zopfii]GEK30589.1 hypothetical protein KZO01_08980 [Kurthia zopfii]STX10829.1 Uncharacterised protein [Kurthia zopfii]